MAKYALYQTVVVPALDKGGLVVAIEGPEDAPVYSVDFDRGDVHTFPEDELAPQAP